MAILVFMLPFDAEMHRPDAEQLARQLQLTLTRVDDWDREMAFRIVGTTGTIAPLQTIGRRGHRRFTTGTSSTAAPSSKRTTIRFVSSSADALKPSDPSAVVFKSSG